MKHPNITCTVVFITLISTQSNASDTPTITGTPTGQYLILAVDAIELANHSPRNDTYDSRYSSKDRATASTLTTKVDVISKKLKGASKAFKRMTSVRYGKGQKIRAKLGKSSVTFKYTRAL